MKSEKTESESINEEPFIFIPNIVNAVVGLKASERDVLAVIVGLSKKDGYCFIKNETLTQVAGVKSVRGVQYILRKLKSKKLIYINVTRYKKSEIKEGKSRYGTVRKISPVIGNIINQGLKANLKSNENPFMGVMKDQSHNILNSDIKSNNYLDDQKSSTYKENSENLNPVPLSKTRNEVVFRSMINKASVSFLLDKDLLTKHNIKKNEIRLARKSLLYYLLKYEALLGEEHILYKQEQLNRCYLGFIMQVQILRDQGWSLEYIYRVMREVINRWLTSIERDKNNLRLNHYFGNWDNEIFYRCLEYVGLT